jgi:hypothetical protein
VSASYLTAALMTGIAAGIMFIVGVSFAVNRREHRADSEMRTAWEQEVAGTTMPPWDGLTWDWPETGLARYLDQTAELPDFEPVCTEPVPASQISGPFRMLASAQETGDAISDMVARTDEFIAMMSSPQEG